MYCVCIPIKVPVKIKVLVEIFIFLVCFLRRKLRYWNSIEKISKSEVKVSEKLSTYLNTLRLAYLSFNDLLLFNYSYCRGQK